jgi:hypothetical protein
VRFFRGSLLALGAAVALASCAAPGVTPLHDGPHRAAAKAGSAQSPCDVAGTWHFHGPCVAVTVKPHGTTVDLPQYNGVAIGISFQKNFVSRPTDLVVTAADGRADITGTDRGAAFPLYSNNCVDAAGTSVKCRGKASLYFSIEDPTKMTSLRSSNGRILFLFFIGRALRATRWCDIVPLTAKGWLVAPKPSARSAIAAPSWRLTFAMTCGS